MNPALSLFVGVSLIGAAACTSAPGLPVAPEGQRVDLFQPKFSQPTKIINPLYPVSAVNSVLLLGKADDAALRVEVTRLPGTKVIEWNGVPVETVISQYIAYRDGRLAEAAIDWYAQDDAGAVWYFGEEVTNYENGVLKDREGSWLAGRDGPAAMIMPANPKPGDVWRPENIPGKVFEEVTVRSVTATMPGPHGQVTGIVDTEQRYLDGHREPKAYAPGYGEFSTGTPGQDLEAVAIADPMDILPGAVPYDLADLTGSTLATQDAAAAGDWRTATACLARLTAAWQRYSAGNVPPMIKSVLTDALDGLHTEVNGQDPAAAAHSALDLAQAAFDLQLRHRPATEIDHARLGIHLRRLALDLVAKDIPAILAEVTTLEWIRDRVAHTLPTDARTRLNTGLADLRTAANAGDLTRAAALTSQLRG